MSYKIGDKVRATRDIMSEADEDSSEHCCAKKGATLIVSGLDRWFYPIQVRHEGEYESQKFGVAIDEIEPFTE